MTPAMYTQIILAERPPVDGSINEKTFRVETTSYADLKPGAKQVLFKTHYLSCDPTQRVWINDTKGYLPPVQLGDVMRSTGLGIVVEAGEGSAFKPGDAVEGLLGWREYGVLDDKALKKIEVPDGAELLDFLGPLGTTGLTAYFGTYDVGKVKAGETLVVSGAAGATGSIVCQIGKRLGAKVIAIAGSKEKCEWLEKDIGVDKALNYKSSTFKKEFVDSVGFFDVYFDNVGGDILNFALARMKMNARIVLCGAISDYNSKPTGLTNYSNLIIQRAKIEGFLVLDYASQYNAARAEIIEWLKDNSLRRQFHIIEGIENCPNALPMLYTGGNTGKLVVKVAELQSPSKL